MLIFREILRTYLIDGPLFKEEFVEKTRIKDNVMCEQKTFLVKCSASIKKYPA